MKGPLAVRDAKVIASEGERIYSLQRAALEESHRGEFAAIDIEKESISLGATAEEAVNRAQHLHPDAIVHLVRIGFAAAFHFSSVSHGAPRNR